MSPLQRFRQSLVRQLETGGGRHDEPFIYEGEPGDPGLAGGPGSLSWEIHGDLASVIAAGMGAILLEVLHPSVMSGVAGFSSYRTEPERRARNTLGYVLRTTFGSTPGALRVIEQVKRLHGQVNGQRPDGVAFRALEPELIGWVHTCIPWAVMLAFDRYRRPLSLEEKNRYLTEQAVIGRLGGAGEVPETVSQLADYVEAMRPKLAFTSETLEFLGFLSGTAADAPLSRGERLDRWSSIRASMGLMPRWAQQLTGTDAPEWLQRLWLRPGERLKAGLVRWAYPELPCKRIALARASAPRSNESAAA